MPKIRIAARNDPPHKTYLFWCPGCDTAHGPNDTWQFNGDVNKPTLSPSVLVNQGRRTPAVTYAIRLFAMGRFSFWQIAHIA